MNRPLSLTIVAWALIVMGVLTLSSLGSLGDPQTRELMEWMGLDIRLQIALAIFGGIVMPAAGFGLLKGAGWARDLIALYMIVTLVAAFYILGDLFMISAIPTAVMYVVALAVLYNPTTTAYLNGTYDPDTTYLKALQAYRRGQGAESDLVRVLGVIVLIGCAILVSVVVMVDAFLVTLPGRGPIMAVTFVFVSMAIAVGVLMWGRRRWKMSLGWVLATGGSYGAMSIYFIRHYRSSDLFSMLLDDVGHLPAIGGGGLAVVIALTGAALVVTQRRRDREAVLA